MSVIYKRHLCIIESICVSISLKLARSIFPVISDLLGRLTPHMEILLIQKIVSATVCKSWKVGDSFIRVVRKAEPPLTMSHAGEEWWVKKSYIWVFFVKHHMLFTCEQKQTFFTTRLRLTIAKLYKSASKGRKLTIYFFLSVITVDMLANFCRGRIYIVRKWDW